MISREDPRKIPETTQDPPKDPERKREESISITYYINTGRMTITPCEDLN
jgi:hypothetical protein